MKDYCAKTDTHTTQQHATQQQLIPFPDVLKELIHEAMQLKHRNQLSRIRSLVLSLNNSLRQIFTELYEVIGEEKKEGSK